MSTPEQSVNPDPIEETEVVETGPELPPGPPERKSLDIPELNERGQWTPIPEPEGE